MKIPVSLKTYAAMLESGIKTGLPVISADTFAKLLAIVYASNSEMVTHCPKMVLDCGYAQKRFHIEGSEVPDADFTVMLVKYVREIEEHLEKTHAETGWYKLPEWCNEFVRERYGIKKLF